MADKNKNNSITPIKDISSKTYDVTPKIYDFVDDDEVSQDTGVDTMNSRKRSRSSAFSTSYYNNGGASEKYLDQKSRSPNTRDEMRVVSGNKECSIINEHENENSIIPGALKPSYSSPHITSSPTSKPNRKFISTVAQLSPRQQSLPASFHSTNSGGLSSFPVLRKYETKITTDEAFPIKANGNSLNWGSVKLRRTVEKSIQIKNSAHRRVVIKILISGPGFQVRNKYNTYVNTLHT